MRFFQNGDFTTRSNGVETAYRRVNPDDWDDDGIANERDLNPLLCDGDFYGVANALPSNANLNAYYWLDLSVTGLLDCATIRVTCDGPSDLGDHVVIARTNQVCHIPSAWEPTIRGPIDQDQWNVVQLMALTNGTDGLECYFVNSFGDDVDVLGCNCEYGMAITADGTGVTLAHEIGHAFNLKDIYASNESSTNATVTLKMIPEDEMPRNVYMESDWNAGCRGHGIGGGRYYRKDETHVGIINRMLMNGSVERAFGGRDITMGQVHGVRCRGQGTSDTDWTVEKVPVGFFTDADRSSAPVHD